MKAMIYLDTNIFVYSVINNKEPGEKCRKLIKELINNEETIATSTLTWDEFVYAIWKKEGKELAMREGKKFLQFPNMVFLNTSKEILINAQELMEKYNLKPRDAIHASTAIINKCIYIVSDNTDFDKVKELKRKKI